MSLLNPMKIKIQVLFYQKFGFNFKISDVKHLVKIEYQPKPKIYTNVHPYLSLIQNIHMIVCFFFPHTCTIQ